MASAPSYSASAQDMQPAAPTLPNEAPTPALQSFPELRAAILNQIGSATQRVWLATDYLTDGEICAALYLAQYRNINVQVLLGRKSANQYMSRLKFLKDQNIPVFLKPLNFSDKAPTTLLVDDKLLRVDSDLNFLGKSPSYAMKTVTDAGQVQSFVNEFNAASQQKIKAVPKPVPLVGRPGVSNPAYQPPVSLPPSPPTQPAQAGISEDVYNYDRHRQKQRQAPAGVTQRLPRETIQQQSRRGRPLPKTPAQPAQMDITPTTSEIE